jgi:phage-related protein
MTNYNRSLIPTVAFRGIITKLLRAIQRIITKLLRVIQRIITKLLRAIQASASSLMKIINMFHQVVDQTSLNNAWSSYFQDS